MSDYFFLALAELLDNIEALSVIVKALPGLLMLDVMVFSLLAKLASSLMESSKIDANEGFFISLGDGLFLLNDDFLELVPALILTLCLSNWEVLSLVMFCIVRIGLFDIVKSPSYPEIVLLKLFNEELETFPLTGGDLCVFLIDEVNCEFVS
jgi:hypothetical protein